MILQGQISGGSCLKYMFPWQTEPDLVGLKLSPGTCIFKQTLGDSDSGGPQTTFSEALIGKRINCQGQRLDHSAQADNFSSHRKERYEPIIRERRKTYNLWLGRKGQLWTTERALKKGHLVQAPMRSQYPSYLCKLRQLLASLTLTSSSLK